MFMHPSTNLLQEMGAESVKNNPAGTAARVEPTTQPKTRRIERNRLSKDKTQQRTKCHAQRYWYSVKQQYGCCTRTNQLVLR